MNAGKTDALDATNQSRLRTRGLIALGCLTVAVAITLALIPPIPQDQAYHSFADQRGFFGMPNFLNVISNAPFLLTGVAGLVYVFGTGSRSFLDPGERWAYVILFVGVALTCFGSGYYHAAPADQRLVWDRLPMTLGFMSFFSATISERINTRLGQLLLVPLVLIGGASVFYWDISGDLRPYVGVQFYPLIAIPLATVLFKSRYTRGSDIALIIGFYAGAKVLEQLDAQILAVGNIVSGHSLKHVAAAGATWAILRMIKLREPSA
jgi:hypothetical protein